MKMKMKIKHVWIVRTTMRIKPAIFDIPVINNVILYEETDSTNTRAKTFGDNGCVDGTLIIADTQTAGKGRMGRSFSSPADTGIYMSLLQRPDIEPSLVSGITLLAAMAVAQALTDIDGTDIKPQIKWPNDVLINGKKAVGILTETSCADSLSYIVTGIGINVNNTSFPEELSQTACSLYLCCGRRLDREDIIYKVWESFSAYYLTFLAEKNLAFITKDYNSLLASYGQPVYVLPHKKTIGAQNPYLIDTTDIAPCLCMGIDSHGALICRHNDGRLEHVNAGEVSVRGPHGYT